MNIYKGLVAVFLIGLVIFTGIDFYFVSHRNIQDIYYSKATTTTSTTTKSVSSDSKKVIIPKKNLFSKCGLTSSNFVCLPITQGYKSADNPAPTVCGCAPTCGSGESILASSASGTWSDGSSKGTFVCSEFLPS